MNQIETYYEYGFKINRMKNSKNKNKNPNNEEGWRKKTEFSISIFNCTSTETKNLTN